MLITRLVEHYCTFRVRLGTKMYLHCTFISESVVYECKCEIVLNIISLSVF